MASQKFSKLIKLINRFKYLFLGVLLLTFLIIGYAFFVYYHIDTYDNKDYWTKVADFLLIVGENMLNTIAIGLGLGGVINFIFEEMKKEEEEIKDKLKVRQDKRDKNKQFRREMLGKLQEAHDQVELARVLIQSHKSGRTYGEQIRNKIMPSLIILQDFKRRLSHAEDRALIKNMDYLQVSLTYMAAYLTVLMEEFAKSYIEISNLQNYQDALGSHMRTLFTELIPSENEEEVSLEEKKKILENAEKRLDELNVPSKINAVWQAMEELDYVWDFIDEFRNDKGNRSHYYKIFLLHYFHCLKILKSHNSIVNENLVNTQAFQDNLAELQRLKAKKESDQPLTRQDSLTRKIMSEELFFDFATKKRSSDTSAILEHSRVAMQARFKQRAQEKTAALATSNVFPQLQTERLILNQLQLTDTPAIVRLAGNEKIARMTLNIPHPYQQQDAKDWILASHKHFEEGTQYTFAIRKAQSPDLIGAIGLILTPRHKRAAAGYWIGEPYWNQGYTSEALAALLHYGFQELNLNKIYATHLISNPASGKVMIKNGMILEGELMEHYSKGDVYRTVKQYRLLKEEWEVVYSPPTQDL